MNKAQVINEIESRIYSNNNGAITAEVLQGVLKNIVEFAVELSEQSGGAGKDGVGISSIEPTPLSGDVGGTRLTITLTDNSKKVFSILNGKDGAQGAQGPKGANGKDGKDGLNGVDGVNGRDGVDGIDGKDGKDGLDGYVGRDGRDGKDGKDGRDGRDGRDGEDGKDGENGKDGLNGKDGAQGRTGAAIRGPYNFDDMSATTRWWCSGEIMVESEENHKWIDIVVKDGTYYYCKIGYYGRLAPWENVVEDHWEEGSSFEFIATKLLLSKNACINFLTGNELYLRNEAGNITAGAAGGDGINFWAGAENPSDATFKVHNDGKLEASNAYIAGHITAHSLSLGNESIEDYVDSKITDYSANSGMNYAQVNDAIETFLNDNGYITNNVLTGYVTDDLFESWVDMWNAAHSGQTLTDDEIEELAHRVVGAEISNVFSLTRNPDGSITHTMNIGGREYTWITYDAGDYVLLGAVFSGMSGNELTKFVVSKQGLLQANNAIIYGKIYASEGYFHGSVSATDGYFKGDVTANSLTLGNNQSIEDYVGSQISGYAAQSGMNYDQVNEAIRDFLTNGQYVQSSALTGYVTGDLFQSWIDQWNASHSGQTLTDEEIEELAHRVFGAEISNVISVTQNPDGSLTHVMNIGGTEYTWVTYDAGDYVILGAVFSGMSGNELTKFVVSKNGLLQANNAIIYGKIYASEGYFHGSVSATDGYFKGDVTANSLTLGNNQSIEDYVDSQINGYASQSGMNYDQVNEAIREFLSNNDYIQSSALTGYVTSGLFESWIEQWNASHSGQTLTDEEIEELAHRVFGAEISNVISVTRNEDGSITHTMSIGGNEYTWVTYDAGDYVLLGAVFSGMSGDELTKFVVSKNGLLQANNAIIYGKVYASEGYFHGSVSATDGYFKGDITAHSLTLGNDQSIEDYVDGRVSSLLPESGISTGDVLNIVTDYVSSKNFLSGSVLDGYVTEDDFLEWMKTQSALTSAYVQSVMDLISGAEISWNTETIDDGSGHTAHTITIGGHEYSWDTYDLGNAILLDSLYSGETESGVSKFIVDKNGLLQANNAIIYGKVYASEGYFKGTVEATDGVFHGAINAASGTIGGITITPEGLSGHNLLITNEYVFSDNVEFKGSISADNGYFKGDIVANSLKLGNHNDQTFEDYVSGKITEAVADGIDADAVNQLINDYITESGITMDGYMSESAFTAWLDEWNASHPDNPIDDAAASAISKAVFDAEISKVFSSTSSGGVTTHTAVIGDRTYTWKTVDTGDYLLVDTGLGELNSGSTGGFIISREGLLEAYNALIYGKIYASEGYFKGSVSADNGYFKGDIVATSLKLGSDTGQTVQDYVNGKITEAVADGIDADAVNQLINDYIRESGITMDGYMSESAFTAWVEEWNASHPNDPIDEAAASAISKAVFDAEISNVFTSETSGGITTHTAVIGDRTYSWKTVDTGDYLLIDTGLGELDSASTGGFIVSRDGLVEAYNALIYGKIYASEGYFKGSVSADNGYFKGSISAENGYFNGKIVASEGSIGNIDITPTGLSGTNINITNNYMYSDNVAFKGSISADNGYFSGNVYANDGVFRGDVYANNGEFNGAITATSLTLVDGAHVDVTPEAIGIDTSQFIKLDSGITGNRGEVLISRSGLLQAKNAVISGSVYAEDSYFRGTVHATDGDFRGSISAESGYFKGSVSATNGYFNGNIVAVSGTIGGIQITENGLSGKNINITNNYFFSDNVEVKGSISADNGYFKGDLTANSLTLANNAVVSGAVYATRGKIENITASTITATTFSATNSYFKGKIDADSGYFKGNITANSLTLASNASVSGTVYATNGKFENLTGKNLTMSNSFFSGNVYAANGYFNGDVTANSLTLGNNAYVSGAVYATKGKIEKVTASTITATTFSATNSYFKGKIEADDGYFHGDVVARSLTLGSKDIDDYVTDLIPEFETVSSGDIKNVVLSALSLNSWGVVQNLGSAITLNTTYGSVSSVTISKEGLLVAKNAIVSGTVFAYDGVFNGKVYAKGGEFSGAVKATSLQLGNDVISSIPDENDFVKIDHKYGTTSSVTISTNGLLTAKNAIISGTVYANSGVFNGKVYATGGEFSGAVKATSLQLGNDVISSIPDEDDFVKIDHKYGNVSSVTISTDGLLTAKNAIVSGTIYANSGVFNGTVYANDGKFNGAISATSLHLGSNAVVSGAVYATNGKFENISATNVSMKNSFFSGNVYANNGYFKGTVEADDGYFKGELRAAKGSFSGAITATSLYLGGESVTGIPSTEGFLELGETYGNGASSVTISTDGLLVAKNAVISGTVYANDGIFNGTIHATDGYFKGTISANTGYIGGWEYDDSGLDWRFYDGVENFADASLGVTGVSFSYEGAGMRGSFRAGTDGIRIYTEDYLQNALYIGGYGKTPVTFEGDGEFYCEKKITGLYGTVNISGIEVDEGISFNSGNTYVVGSNLLGLNLGIITTGTSSGDYFSIKEETDAKTGVQYKNLYFNNDLKLLSMAYFITNSTAWNNNTWSWSSHYVKQETSGTNKGKWTTDSGEWTGIYGPSFTDNKGDTLYFTV